jgi:hypothetical protein
MTLKRRSRTLLVLALMLADTKDQGCVLFTIKPKATVASGTEITNQPRMVFKVKSLNLRCLENH